MNSPILVDGIQYTTMTKTNVQKKKAVGLPKQRKPKQAQKQTRVRSRPVRSVRSMAPVPAPSLSEDIGSLVGRGVSKFASWLGLGDYELSKNTILGIGGAVPTMHSTNDSIMVRHREYVGDLISSTTFNNQSISVNPGLFPTFPWLSTIASNFQEYTVHGMVVEYVPLLSEVASNEVSLGYVTLAAQYRTDLPCYPSNAIALESEFAVSTKPNLPLCLAIECKPELSPYKRWYVRTGAASGDIKTFDFVNINILIGGMQSGAQVAGQIWISYEIELLHPTNFLAPPENTLSIHYQAATPTAAVPIGTASALYRAYVNPYGSQQLGGAATIAAQAAADGFSVINPSAGVAQLFFPRGVQGSFQIVLQWTGNSTSSVVVNSSSGATTYTNCSADLIFNNDTQSGISAPDVATTVSILIAQFAVTISTTQASVGQANVSMFNSNTVVPTGGYFNLYVQQTSYTA